MPAGYASIFSRTSLTGGTARALDAIGTVRITDGDVSFTVTSTYNYVHIYDASSAAAESSPDVIAADDAGATGRWLLNKTYAANMDNVDHGTLTGNADDDHTQYLLADASRTVGGHFLPDGDGTRNLGSVAATWNDLHAVTLYGDGSNITGLISGPGYDWTDQVSTEDNQWYDVTYGNGLFVTVSYNGTNQIATSPDGVNWTSRSEPEPNQWLRVAYGAGMFVSVAMNGTNRVMTSPDGITWTARAAAQSNVWTGITYGKGQFVAVSQSGGSRVMTSPDGITWTSQTAASAISWQRVCYGNGTYVAVSDGGGSRVMTSTDGISWTSRSATSASAWNGVAYGNGLFVAVGTNGALMTSPDGASWTARTPTHSNNWHGVTWGAGLFVAVAISGSNNRVMTSPDGITWTERTTTAANSFRSVAFGNGMFVACGSSGESGNRFMTSGLSESNVPPLNNILQGGWTIKDTLTLSNGTSINEFSTDGTMAGNSDDAVPTEKAIVTYVNTVSGVLAGGGVSNHSGLTELVWNDSGHTGISGSHVIHQGDETVSHMFDMSFPNSVVETITIDNDRGGLTIDWAAGEVYDVTNALVVDTVSGTGQATNNDITFLYWVSGSSLTFNTTEPDIEVGEVKVGHVSTQNSIVYGLHQEPLLKHRESGLVEGIANTLTNVVNSGMIISEDVDATNALDVDLSAGVFYHEGHIKVTITGAVSRTDGMVRHFHTSGAWDSENNAEIDTAFYNDGTDKAAASNKWYKSLFIVDLSNNIHWIYPTAQYNTVAQALAGAVPATPPGLEIYPHSTVLVYQGGSAALPAAGSDNWIDARPMIRASAAGGAVTDHGLLTGLTDDDHTGYHTDARASTWLGTESIATIGTKDHDLLDGLADDDHTQYILHTHGTGTDNLVGGSGAGAAIAGGANNNVILGDSAGAAQTTADFNTIVGADAGLTLTTAQKNTLIGYQAGRDLKTTTGSDSNTFVGYQAGYDASTGLANVYIGASAGVNSTGTANVFVGTNAGGSVSASNGDYNVFIGAESGLAANTAQYNVFVGAKCGRTNISANNNVGMGYETSYHNQTGTGNVCIGYQAAKGVVSNNHSNNTLLGYQTGFSVTTGSDNILIGYQAGYSITTDSDKLYIENSNSASPLIYGEFDNNLVKINGDLEVTTSLTIIGGSELRLNDVGDSNYVGFEAPALVANQIWVLPDADGNNTEVIQTDGAGNLTWAANAVGDLVDDLTPQLGGDLDYNGNSLHHTAILTGDDTYQGEVITVTVDDADTVFGSPLFCADDFNYERADAVYTAKMPCRAVALVSGTGSNKVLVQGQICDTSWTWVNGNMYVGTDIGTFTQTEPSVSGSQIQVLGWALSADTIYFNPEYTMTTSTGTDPIPEEESVGDIGVFMGGYSTAVAVTDVIDYITITSPSNAIDFGNLLTTKVATEAASNGGSDRGVSIAGYIADQTSVTEYITISSPSNSTDFGNLIGASDYLGACSNNTNDRGMRVGGRNSGNIKTNIMEYITISSNGNGTDFGDLQSIRISFGATSNGTNERGFTAGGQTNSSYSDVMDYWTINSPSNSTDFGNLDIGKQGTSCTSNTTNERGIISNARDGASSYNTQIEYVTLNSPGNGTDFGDAIAGHSSSTATSNSTNERGVIAAGYDGAGRTNIIEYITISTPSNGTDFGDLTVRGGELGACSNS